VTSGTFQHYIPQFLLREFGHGKRGRERIHVYDKKTGQEFETKISEIGADYGFYDAHGISLDDLLTDLEIKASREIHLIVKNHSLKGLDRPQLALFLAVQEIRTEAHRSRLRRIAVERLFAKRCG
jgi:hypothetical protein